MSEQTELDLLKERAVKMGIKFHHAIGEKKLKELIDAKLNPPSSEKKPEVPQLTEKQVRQRRHANLRKRVNILVRIRVTNMNPNKKDMPGEYIGVSNRVIGTVSKYIPYNIDAPYHVPQVILDVMRERMCQVFVKRKVAGGRTVMEPKMIKEFAIEVLPALTQDQIDDLAKKQAMAGGLD